MHTEAHRRTSAKTHGVSVRFRAERRSWEVLWRDAGGKQRRLSCPSKRAADERAVAMRQTRERHGRATDAGDPHALAELRLIRAALGTATVAQLLAVWERHKGEVIGGRADLLTAAAVERFLAMREAEGLAGDSLAQSRAKLGRLVASLGDRPLVALDHEVLRTWLAGTGFTGWSLVHHDKVARSFFARAVKEGWLVASPMSRLPFPQKPADEVVVMPVAAGVRLFSALRDDPISARLALEAFGGIRYSGAGRIEPHEILWKERAIVIPAEKSKDKKRHYLQGHPDNLWLWLERWRKDERAWAPLTKRQQQYAKSGAFAAAGVANPGNVLRHSFCSYLIARDKDAAKCAHLMQHAAPAMLYRHYRGAASEEDGAAWFAIAP